MQATRRAMRFLSQREAQRVDEELMSSKHGFSIDQLMELAGLSVASALGSEFPSPQIANAASTYSRVLVVAGPGNNGGDALVAARHLKHFGYAPSILYPKRTARPLFQGLVTQCEQLGIPFVDHVATADAIDAEFDVVLDGIFGFSFEGAIRAPFDGVIQTLKQCRVPIVSIDIPSGWHVERGDESGAGLDPHMLVSLTAPKLCAQHFAGPHYVGGRFVPRTLADDLGLDLPAYTGMAQCVKL